MQKSILESQVNILKHHIRVYKLALYDASAEIAWQKMKELNKSISDFPVLFEIEQERLFKTAETKIYAMEEEK